MAPPGVAVVTGAGGGIGRALCLALVTDGWQLGLIGRSPGALDAVAAEIRDRGGQALTIPLDLRRSADLPAAFARIEAELGPVEALVNNAGVQRLATALEVTESDWDDVLDTNLKAAFFCCQAAGRNMVARGRGSIVNVSSAAGTIAVAERAAYGASKAGLAMLTRILALEWAPHGVRVNAVAPTFVDTALGRATLDQPGRRAEIVGRIPLRRLADTADVAGAVRFLLDPRAAGFVTGHILAVDGGLTLR